MEILVIDEASKTIWRRQFCSPLKIHHIKLLVKTYNDVKELKYQVLSYKQIPSKFIENNYYIKNMNSALLDDMKNQLLEKRIL